MSLFLLAVISSFLYGVLIELLQYLTLRHPELLDLAANFAGSLGGPAVGAAVIRQAVHKTRGK